MTDNESLMCGNEFDALAQKNVQKTFKKPLTAALLFVTMGAHTEKDRAKYMRTKALLAGAMIGAASLATSMAQVYSVNIVGYVNMTFPARAYSLVQNPLNNTSGNTIANVLPSFTGVPIGSYIRVYKWDPTLTPPRYITDTWAPADPDNDDPGGWSIPGMILNPGQGFFLYNPNTAAITSTFVGEVATGNLVTPVYGSFNMVGSAVPQEGGIGALGYVPTDTSYERVYVWNNTVTPNRYMTYTYSWPDIANDDPGGWSPSEPVLPVGSAVFLYRPTGGSNAWTRTFNVQ